MKLLVSSGNFDEEKVRRSLKMERSRIAMRVVGPEELVGMSVIVESETDDFAFCQIALSAVNQKFAK